MSDIQNNLSDKITNMSFVCALLVILNHVGGISRPGDVLYCVQHLGVFGVVCVAVPYFFCVSGYFLARHNVEDMKVLSGEIRKRIYSLAIPFVCWNLLWLLFTGIFFPLVIYLTHGGEVHFNVSVKRLLSCVGWGNPCLGVLWYVKDLIIFVLLSPIIIRLNKCKLWLLLPMMGWFLSMAYSAEPVRSVPMKIFFRNEFSLFGLFYFSLGMMLGRGVRFHAIENVPTPTLIVVGVGLLGLRILLPNYPGPELALRDFANVFLLYFLWRIMPSKLFFDSIRGLPFMIYCLHMFVIFVVQLLLKGYRQSVALYCADCVLSVAITVFLAIGLRKWFPRVSVFFSGGRAK